MRPFALAAVLATVVAASAKQIVITVGDPLTPDNATTVFRPPEVKANIGDVVFFNSRTFQLRPGVRKTSDFIRDMPPLQKCSTGVSGDDAVTRPFSPRSISARLVFHDWQNKARLRTSSIPYVTQGNHSAIQSTFASPCIPAHDTNITINGFNSGFRPTNNGTAITNLPVTISTNDTIWFYDAATCAEGGVGGININDSSTETLEGFQRNAIRLNGTATSSSAASSATATSPSGTSSGASTSKTPTSGSASNGAATERVVVRAVGAVVPMVLVSLML
ncbi:hypothetical protein BD414DRAFT_554099 [Trametes punicea]|nr:hypothetical protein BD414DRAFT_554099 [Trametes punicea]